MDHPSDTASEPKRVLVVDPDGDSRQLTCCALRAAGCDVLEAADGREALAAALARMPSLVVTESWLPFIDGFTLCRLLRGDAMTRSLPILILTTETQPSELERARVAGADGIVLKATAPEVLLMETRRLLARSVELEGRSREMREQLSKQLERSAQLTAFSGQFPRTKSKAHERFMTTTPALAPPQLVCPECDRPLRYERSHIGGVSGLHAEQWDYFTCSSCGTFQYRQRTRKVRRVS